MFIYRKGFVFALTSLWKTQIIPQILKRNEPLTFKWIFLPGFPHINMDSRWVHHRSQIPWILRSLCFLPCSAMTRPKLCCILAERCGIWDRSWTPNLCLIPIFQRRIREMEERCRYYMCFCDWCSCLMLGVQIASAELLQTWGNVTFAKGREHVGNNPWFRRFKQT